VGTPTTGRGHPQLEPLIGYFVNAVPVRADLSGNPLFSDLLVRTRETVLEAYRNEEFLWERVRASLGDALFHVWFTVLTYSTGRLGPHVTMKSMHAGARPSRFDLSLIFEPDGEGMLGILEYSTELVEAASAARMAAGIEQVIDCVIADPDIGLLQLCRRQREAEGEALLQEVRKIEQKHISALATVHRRSHVQ
jgi:non-ribosomal peptide synthetase component F